MYVKPGVWIPSEYIEAHLSGCAAAMGLGRAAAAAACSLAFRAATCVSMEAGSTLQQQSFVALANAQNIQQEKSHTSAPSASKLFRSRAGTP